VDVRALDRNEDFSDQRHGGGGRGLGSGGSDEHLIPFLPTPRLRQIGGRGIGTTIAPSIGRCRLLRKLGDAACR